MVINEKEWYIEAPWGRICIVAWGHCYDPPVLLCHGVNDSMATFRPLIRLLPKNFYYIGVEFPGNGRSDPFPPGLLFNFYDLVYTLEVVVKHFRWQSFMFLGHSAGASIGMLYDFCFPERISRSILLDPITPVIPSQDFAKWYKKTYQAFFDDYEFYNAPQEQRPMYTRKEALNKLVKARTIPLQIAEDTLDRISETVNGQVRFTYDQRFKVIPQPPFSPDQLRKLCVNSKTQALVITTEDSVNTGKYTNMPFLIDESVYKNNSVRVRSVAGHHNIHISNPERFAPFVAPFLVGGPEGLDAKSKL